MMTEKKTQHERRQKMHEDDLRQIQEYEEYFKQLEIEKAERAEKERIEAEKRAEEERAQKVLHDAAAKIQALFRGVQCRKEQAKSAGKKGKKGKVCIIHAVLLQRWLQHAASAFATASLIFFCAVRVLHEC